MNSQNPSFATIWDRSLFFQINVGSAITGLVYLIW